MPVPQEVRDKITRNKELNANMMKYQVATIEGKVIFLQEAEWVLNSKKPIPEGKLVAHKDGNTLNNQFDNLYLVDENTKYGDFHQESNKVFHENNLEKNKEFIERQFVDIYKILFKK